MGMFCLAPVFSLLEITGERGECLMLHLFHKLCRLSFAVFFCVLAGCHEDGTVYRNEIHLISDGFDEDGNLALRFELNTQYQGVLYAALKPEGDEIQVSLYTRPTHTASRKLLYSGGYLLVIPWPENAGSVEVVLCGMKLGSWDRDGM